MLPIFWLTAGFLVGVAHAAMLWRGSNRLSAITPVWGFVRLILVAAVLVTAAINGEILWATGGWIGGLATSVLLVLAFAGRGEVPVESLNTDQGSTCN